MSTLTGLAAPDRTTAEAYRRRRRRRNGLAGRGDLLDRLVPGVDPVAHRGDARLVVQAGSSADLARLDERQHRPAGAGASRTSGAVQVVLRVVRRVEVHDQVDVVDVDAAGGDIGGHQHPRVTGGEAGQRALALVLVQVAVDRGGRGTRAC